jgi:cathepsin X
MCQLIFENRTAVPVRGARRFKVKEWGYLNASREGETTSSAAKLAEMQAEIMTRGPIVCSMNTDDDHNPLGAWHCYEGGVYTTKSTFRSTNHVISLLGWGEDAGVPYWVGRHSGGTIFGEEGFFRIERGVNALNIESHCGYATVLDPDPPRANASRLPCENGVPRA